MRPAKKKVAGWCAIAVVCVSGFEGLRTIAYADPVGIPTICFGETQGVRLGDRATVEQCQEMLVDSLHLADQSVRSCVKVPLPDERRAAMVSFTYNVGGRAFCGSTLARKLNAGDTVGACDQLTRWVYAKGVKLPGLVKRRAAEREMCLRGPV